jgi:hypothetical protein
MRLKSESVNKFRLRVQKTVAAERSVIGAFICSCFPLHILQEAWKGLGGSVQKAFSSKYVLFFCRSLSLAFLIHP